MKNIVILGAVGNCVDILDAIQDINGARPEPRYRCLGFLDDNPASWGKDIGGVRVLGPLERAKEMTDAFFVNGIGSSSNFWRKEAILGRLGLPRDRFETIVHPTACVSRMSSLGSGTVILPLVTIATRVTIGDHVIVLGNTVINHDDSIGDYSCITSGVNISGGVTVGRSCYLGTNCSIRGNLKIGDYCLIGMGSIVLEDVPDNCVVQGVPAKFVRRTREPSSG